MRRLALLLALAPCGAMAAEDTAQLLEERKAGPVVELAPTPPPSVDTTGIWYHLRRQDRAAARAEMERLKSENPGWVPPADVLAALKGESVPPPAAQTAKGTAGIDTTRDPGGATAQGWRHLERSEPAKAREWFGKALAWGGGASAREGLGRSLIALGDIDQARALAKDSPVLRPAVADALVTRALAGADTGAPMAAITTDLGTAAEMGRPNGWETVGWRLLDHARPSDALTLFTQASPSEQAIFGQVIAGRMAGDAQTAEALACAERARSDRLRQACADSLAERQLQAYQNGDFATARRLGEQLGEIAPEHRGGRTLLAWSALRGGDPQTAAAVFSELYDSQPDSALAGGLEESLRASGNEAALDARIAAGDRLLGESAMRRQADIAWARKQFDLAARSPVPRQELAGRDDWQVGSGIEMRSTNGQHGQSQFDILAPRLSAQGMLGTVRLDMTLVGARLGTGTAAPGAAIGRRPGTEQSAPLDEYEVALPILALRWEAPDWTVSGRLSTTPLDGPVAARPIGSVAVTHYADPVILGGRLFAESVGGSLLSYGGMRDPVSGGDWGRVVDQGAAAQAIYLPAERVSLALSGEAARLTGDDVKDNSRFALRTDAAYDFRPAGFDHLRLGPFVSYAHFQHNLSHFTYGHGGYYSPDSDLRQGVLLDALSEEGRPWQVELKSSLSFSHTDEDRAARFPLDGSGGFFEGASTDGINTDISLRASALLSERLILSGFGRYSAAPNYTDIAFGAFLTVPFSPRAGVFSTDLPDGIFSPFR